ncbi:hypothetical protein C6W10_17075 [Plantactinospora sp. BB1]|nr:hypothetical protein C6W10_17075 [Plantactinospora sp. BB1]
MPDCRMLVTIAEMVVAEPIAYEVSSALAWDSSSPAKPAAESSATVRSPIRIAFGPRFGRTPSRPITHGWRSSISRVPAVSTDAPTRQLVSPTSGT